MVVRVLLFVATVAFGLSTFLASNTSFLGSTTSLPVLSDLEAGTIFGGCGLCFDKKHAITVCPVCDNFVPVCKGQCAQTEYCCGGRVWTINPMKCGQYAWINSVYCYTVCNDPCCNQSTKYYACCNTTCLFCL